MSIVYVETQSDNFPDIIFRASELSGNTYLPDMCSRPVGQCQSQLWLVIGGTDDGLVVMSQGRLVLAQFKGLVSKLSETFGVAQTLALGLIPA